MFLEIDIDLPVKLLLESTVIRICHLHGRKIIGIKTHREKPGGFFFFVFNLQPDRLDAFFIKRKAEYLFTLVGTEHRSRHSNFALRFCLGPFQEIDFLHGSGLK
jgi:hypothetical protein